MILRKCSWGSISSLNQQDEKGFKGRGEVGGKKGKENNLIMYYNLAKFSNMLPLPINRPTHVVGRLFRYNVTLVKIEHLSLFVWLCSVRSKLIVHM